MTTMSSLSNSKDLMNTVAHRTEIEVATGLIPLVIREQADRGRWPDRVTRLAGTILVRKITKMKTIVNIMRTMAMTTITTTRTMKIAP